MKPTILLVGITGFAGKTLLRSLVQQGFLVVGVKRSTSNTEPIADLLPQITVYNSDETTWETIFAKHQIDSVINFTTEYGRPGTTDDVVMNTNVKLPVQLAKLSIQYGVKHFWNIDSFWNRDTELEEQINLYAYTKHLAKQQLKPLLAGKVQLINARIFHMFGEGDSAKKFFPATIAKLKRNEAIPMTLGEQLYDIVSVKEVVSIIMFVLEHPEKFTNDYEDIDLGMGKNYRIRYLVAAMKEWCGSSSELQLGAVALRKNEIMEAKANPTRLLQAGYKFTTDALNELKQLCTERTLA